ncbi:AraC family transcriptional regulator [Undibacterium fentianense]|uniref:AraC family transcriptional regulator n=1 Tax=Undibacterium fentianense TaxID=2828728 RepID=A0A941E1I0_9BURK|nr:helix-turn-helix domain-containing protein [Undibacterium fentianense]MBR7800645.1 AraC family transcriptional regulator [Undibacterium fentianense]
MATFISHLQIANAVLCVLMAAQLLYMEAMQVNPKRLLGINCLLYAHQSFALVAMLNDMPTVFSLTRPFCAMLIGPCLYVYFSCVTRPDGALRQSDFLHFLVGILILSVIVFFKPLRAFIDYAILTSFILYTALIGYQIRLGEQALAHLNQFAKPAYRWLKILLLLAVLNIILEVAVNLEMQSGVALRNTYSLSVASLIFFCINISIVLAALHRHDWLEWMYQFGEQKLGLSAITIASDAAHSIFDRWENLVKDQQLHKQEFGITLTHAAKKLQVPARQLSNAINQVYGKSFSVYLNDLRIQEAQALLRNNSDLSMIDIMQASGFSSKSNFNKEFLRVTGMSPSTYRDTNRNSSQLSTR